MVPKLIDTLGEKPAATLMKRVYVDGTGFVASESDVANSVRRMRGAIDDALMRQMRTLMLTMASFTLITWVLLAINAAN